jgi:DNA-binding NarL/FixJ family response regulator
MPRKSTAAKVSPSTISPTRVLVVQDHPLLASAIAKVLDTQEDMAVCGIARSGGEAATMAAVEKPSIVLMDFRLPDLSGPAAAARIREAVPNAAIVFHSAEESETALLDAIDAGAIAYLTKMATADQIIEAVRRASVGEVLIPVALFAKAIARQRKVVTDEEAREAMTSHRASWTCSGATEGLAPRDIGAGHRPTHKIGGIRHVIEAGGTEAPGGHRGGASAWIKSKAASLPGQGKS